MKPQLQIALDVTSLDQALSILKTPGLVEAVDIIEAGTVLLAAEGKKAVKALREAYPHKTLVADFKIADAINTIGAMFFENGANLITVIAAADIVTMANAFTLAQKHHQDVQIELYGLWDEALAKQWKTTGITHIIYHHSRDAAKPWDDTDLERIKLLVGLGYQVSVTGGLNPEHIQLFKDFPVYSFIIGRSLYEAKDPTQMALAFQHEINRIFG
jgi:3-dehydro-L-gulonate-6-phosphate decarboxylase